ncbi:DUF4129 domain-containing protein [Natrinema versiforme]|uniref:Protein-glutamine gamma-glutamyltransferase-like C-terminal domain-containing protein n=1 Tax=Natrinema versiforme JCM 10478 TaxID=1227496 RepID=L9YEN3_9EURY|nr:DUF4129 domain-containing protein [Natrinema versiforme]ELY71408.1 hypothetical protein C489_00531 [Natrinema versiforme JCM 10478]
MTGARRLLLVVGCLCCLFVVASALPAADPRLDGPGGSDGEPIAGDWESMGNTPEFVTESPDDTSERDSESDDESETREIEIDGEIEPGSNVTVQTDHPSHFSTTTIAVNGENVTEGDEFGRATIIVPYAEEMTVSIPEENQSRTFDVRTAATLETHGGAAPARDLEISASVGSTAVPNATVFRDGTAVTTTDDDGEATVTLPETTGPVDLRVERDPIAGNRTVEVAEPTVEFVSPVLFPGSPAPVQVSADGDGVPNATVSLESGGTATTGENGRARLWLPIDDGATVTAEVGAETATVTVGNLYLRLAAVVVLVPGFCIGGVVTYFRLVATSERRRGNAAAALFVALADVLGGLGAALSRLFGAIGGYSLPSISLPTVSMPRLEFGGPGLGFPSFGAVLPSVGRAFGSLPSLGSLGSLGRSSADSDRSLLAGLLGPTADDEDADEPGDSEADDAGRPGLAAEPLTPRGPRAEVRAAWHAFLDRLEIADRETATPGAVAHDALAAGFPADRVSRLVEIVRDIEYGGREPSSERAAAARAAVQDLLTHESDEEGSE